MVASETTNVTPIPPMTRMECAVGQLASRGKLGFALSGLVATAFIFGGPAAWAAEPKAEAKAEAKSESKDA